jgi:hypothetical protein
VDVAVHHPVMREVAVTAGSWARGGPGGAGVRLARLLAGRGPTPWLLVAAASGGQVGEGPAEADHAVSGGGSVSGAVSGSAPGPDREPEIPESESGAGAVSGAGAESGADAGSGAGAGSVVDAGADMPGDPTAPEAVPADAPTTAHAAAPVGTTDGGSGGETVVLTGGPSGTPPAAAAGISPDELADAPTPPHGTRRIGPVTAQFPPPYSVPWPPPAAQQPGQYPGYGQWPPSYPPLPQARRKSGGAGKRIAALLVALVLLVGVVGGGWFLYDRAQRTVELLAADAPGEGFTPNLLQSGALVPTAKFDALANRTPAGNLDGLYLDAVGAAGCNRSLLEQTLQGDPALAVAWATPLGITGPGARDYAATLTPVRLRADTRVTAHARSGETAEPYAAVLQSGTAVLVDDRGTPRVRCADGAPLAASQPVADPYFGDPWGGFDPNAVLEIRPAVSRIPEFGLVDTAGEQPFRRPAATTGADDVAALPETGRLNDSYVLTGGSTRCEGLVNCAGLLTLTPRFTGCPKKCTMSEPEIGDAVALTRDGRNWRASGTPRLPFLCEGKNITTTYTVSFTSTRSQVVDGVWTATSVRGDYERGSPAEAGCVSAQVAWTISGVGG